MNRNLFMKKLLLTTALLGTSILFTACSPAKKEMTETTPASAPAEVASEVVAVSTPVEAASETAGASTAEIATFYGNWVEPNPINDKEVQGFTLNQDLSATSINMETLKYQSWDYKDGNLSLVALSIGNKQSGTDKTTYKVVSVNETTLVLDDQGQQLTYKKQK